MLVETPIRSRSGRVPVAALPRLPRRARDILGCRYPLALRIRRMKSPSTHRRLLPVPLLLVMAALGGCAVDGDSLLVNLTADDKVEKYDLYVRDEASRKIVLHTGWAPMTKDLFKIGLKLPMKGKLTLVIIGVIGEVEDVRPAIGSKQFFYATTLDVKGPIVLDARLLHVPNEAGMNDDADRDLFPDALNWPMHVPAAASIPPNLLDCADGMPVKKVDPAKINPFADEICGDGVDENCGGDDDELCVDEDNDGDPDATDCNPKDPKIHHAINDKANPHHDPFPEAPNCCGYSLMMADPNKSYDMDPTCHPGTCDTNIDYDCDSKFTDCFVDGDCDRYRARTVQDSMCMSKADAHQTGQLDCNDCDPQVRPFAAEICDGIDNNCDGKVDETCIGCDLDGDGFQRTDMKNNCPDAMYKASGKAVDCNDEDAGVFPGSTMKSGNVEGGAALGALRSLCRNKNPDGTVQDADCNGKVDGCPAANCDADGDGFSDGKLDAMCDPQKKFADDCDDKDPTIYPGAPDKCGDGVKQNCTQDNACGAADNDKDGYVSPDDCDDTKSGVHPFALELCDGVDNDCDGLVDEGNPDAAGKPMIDKGQVLHCTDSNVGLCQGPPVGDCVCSASSIAKLDFNQGKRTACPGETAEIDSGAKAAVAAARCYFAPQPKPQSCDPKNPQDDDCDGRVDAPDAKNFPLLGNPCWPAAVGQCKTAMGGKITGCMAAPMGKSSNCLQAFGVNTWWTCETVKDAPPLPELVCPVSEKCNGFDDDCDGKLPASESDVDLDGFMTCGSVHAMYANGQTCEKMLSDKVVGCGDCNDMNKLIKPGAPEICDNVDNDCSPLTGDGTGECGLGGKAAQQTCCSKQMPPACHDIKTETNNCGACSTGGNDHVCDALRANLCTNGGCSCGALGAPCNKHFYCNAGVCTDCNTDLKCGDSCVSCGGGSPKCKADATGCVGCNEDANCQKTEYCLNLQCVLKKQLGKACGAAPECLGINNDGNNPGNCVDGVCCDLPQNMCSGCKQCNLANFLGTCKNVPFGQDPHNACAVNIPGCQIDNCAGDATCNAAIDAQCGDNSCSVVTGKAPFAKCAAGMGPGTIMCNSGTVDCVGFACDAAAKPYITCHKVCTVNTDTNCDTAKFYCLDPKTCVLKLDNGMQCASGNQCKTGNCVVRQDGKTICAAVPACALCKVIDPTGTMCVNAGPGSDPKTECKADVATCKQDNCDGLGSCNVAENTVCLPQTCVNGAPSVKTENLCNAVGTCTPKKTPCGAGFQCNGASCFTTCDTQSDNNCDKAGFFCLDVNTCLAKRPTGMACATGAHECTNGNCQQGQAAKICSANAVACAAKCDVVNVGGTACIPATAASDPSGDCSADPATCKADNCNGGTGATGCDVGDATVCGTPSCMNGSPSVQTDKLCKTGVCTNTPKNCTAGFACNATVCYTACTLVTDAGCSAANYCVGTNTCPVKKAIGSACTGPTAGNECVAPGNCVQTQGNVPAHVCSTPANCNTKCQVVKTNGSACEAATVGTDPKMECTADPTMCKLANCNGVTGATACDVANGGVSCGMTTCAAGMTTGKICGGGTCGDAMGSCMNFACNGNDCHSTCTIGNDTNCLPTFYCSALNTCSAKKQDGSVCMITNECNSGFCLTAASGKRCATAMTCGPCKVVDNTGACINQVLTDVKGDCTMNGTGRTCVSGSCGCTLDTHCTASKPKCKVGGSGTCVECLTDDQCLPTLPRCAMDTCSGCNNGGDCTSPKWGDVCDGVNSCTCTADADCADAGGRAKRCVDIGSGVKRCVCGALLTPCAVGKACSSTLANATCS
ncbi:MAG: hypothetical protein EXR72_16440 [Myxococcales bacterium]|nr:hypothetical protein [Myxococcales bacterium]